MIKLVGRKGKINKNDISLVHCRENNLKNISLDIPRDTFSVITGVSGSGKSSLVFGTIYKESQRRYIASLPSYARQFMDQMSKPDVDSIDGLSASISIDQKTSGSNPRSTVGTITEIYDFLRLLYSRLAQVQCPNGHGEISNQNTELIVEKIDQKMKSKKIFIMAPLVMDRKGEYRKELRDYREAGFRRIRVNKEIYLLEEKIELDRYKKHTLEVVIDYFTVEKDQRQRLLEGIEKAVFMSKGLVSVVEYHQEKKEQKNYRLFSIDNSCAICGYSFSEIEPRIFSFNAVQGMCTQCQGLGTTYQVNKEKIVADPNKAIFNGGLRFLNQSGNIFYTKKGKKEIRKIVRIWGEDIKKPFGKLSRGLQDRIIHGLDSQRDGVGFSMVEGLKFVEQSETASMLKDFMTEDICSKCQGTRLNEVSRNILFRDKKINEITQMDIETAYRFFKDIRLIKAEEDVGNPIIFEIQERLQFLVNVGLEYLTIDRRANTLSGGESQRIRLAAQIGSGLEGCLYILDEPSIGLHQSDNRKLIHTLKKLRDKSNTVYVIEHDEDTILEADHLVDIGPFAGQMGGSLVYNGHPKDLLDQKDIGDRSMTASYILGQRMIELNSKRKINKKETLEMKGVNYFNLKEVSVSIPLKVFNVVVGVSGSGKSTLINKVLVNAFKNENCPWLKDFKIKGKIDKLIEINQKPIGRTSRSNLATYTKAMDEIRDIFTILGISKARGYKKGRFSFNVKDGRCEYCQGSGFTDIETQLFSSNQVVCEYCNGKRFNDSTLEARYKGKNIYEVLELRVDEGYEFFENIPKLKRIFKTLKEIGMGYIKIGQNSTTLSGGEAQRIKLASELSKRSTGNTLYIFDEPSTGLHFYDIEKLVRALNELVEQGNSLIVIEHNMDIISCADHILELGPFGGAKGGEVVFEGSVEDIYSKDTATGREMKIYLDRKKQRKKGLFKNKENFKQLFKSPKKEKRDIQKSSNIVIENLVKNNLKNIDIELPKNQMIAITGLSGSGKTSLAFDTIFQEGQRKYIESLSTYARRFLGRISRAKAERIEGISPTIAIDQKKQGKNPRSTIATQTEVHDCLRVIYSNASLAYCPECQEELKSYEAEQVVKYLEEKESQNYYVIAPIYEDSLMGSNYVVRKKEEFDSFIDAFREAGIVRLMIDNHIVRLDDYDPKVIKNPIKMHILIDRLSAERIDKNRWIEAVEKAYDLSNGYVIFKGEKDSYCFADHRVCFNHAQRFEKKYVPRNFSFNHHSGYCLECSGIGLSSYFQLDRFILFPHLPLTRGAIHPIAHRFYTKGMGVEHYYLKKAGKAVGIDITKVSFKKMSQEQIDYIFFGDENGDWEGLEKRIERLILLGRIDEEDASVFMKMDKCRTCLGQRLNPHMRNMKIDGENISDQCEKNMEKIKEWIENIHDHIPKIHIELLSDVIEELKEKIISLNTLGLSYLTLDRVMSSVSGGESQRIRLATQIGNNLKDILYILDEPTIGLHDRDTEGLISLLKNLKDKGNTVILVEHDDLVIRSCDWIVDIGPQAGYLGGKVTYSGINEKKFLKRTSFYPYLYDEAKTDIRKIDSSSISLKEKVSFSSITHHNLKGVDLSFPLHSLVGISGVSGAGKSSLMEKVIEAVQEGILLGSFPQNMKRESSNGVFPFKSILILDQSPVSRNRRSTLISYMNFFDVIRQAFSQTKMSKERGFTPSHFSYNSIKGHCPKCKGRGELDVEMHFIADVRMVCDKCHGRRYKKGVLEVLRNSKNISEVLGMTVDEAILFFEAERGAIKRLQILKDAGLGYLSLGISLATLSGGELQRLKIAYEISKHEESAETLYVLDEPTTGLHFKDVEMLLKILDKMLIRGASVIAIEHNNLFLKNCDYLIDMGPLAGSKGGEIVNEGTIGDFKENKRGYTWEYL